MNIREKLQNGWGRGVFTIGVPMIAVWFLLWQWPAEKEAQKQLLDGLQKVAFVAGAFAVTAYNLRTRVVDLVLKIEGKPSRVDQFCAIARSCGRRLTNLVVLFTLTSAWLAALTLLRDNLSYAKFATAGAVLLFAASTVSFLYIVFAFERVERFALDEAEKNARDKEANRLFGTPDKPEHADAPTGRR